MQLTVVSYNIHRAIGVDRRFRIDRIAKILDHYAADIVLLQEVDKNVPRSNDLDLAEELANLLGYGHHAASCNVSLRSGCYGNATLSRFPIVAQRNIDLTVKGRKGRGCLHTQIRAEKLTGHPHRLDVFNLHLGLSVAERSQQVGLLVRSNEFSGLANQDPCIVGGDFNDWRARLAPMFTEILDFRCATDHKWGYHQPIRTYPSFSPTGGLDKIFYRGGLRALGARSCRLNVSKVASDHLPVIADFELG